MQTHKDRCIHKYIDVRTRTCSQICTHINMYVRIHVRGQLCDTHPFIPIQSFISNKKKKNNNKKV